ncbi:translationally controlled tumor protein [Dissophora ornata]|nr:translationally controlled tumor protein [Dissophora ornata]
MIIFEDIISGDELFSDAFEPKEVGSTFEIDCAMIKVKKGADVNIGGNASAEEAEETLEDGEEMLNNVIHSGRLQSTSFDKKAYITFMKGYMKAVKAKLALNDVDGKKFESAIATDFKKIVANLKDYEFYTGESMNPEGAVMLLNYREDGTTPYFTVFKDGLKSRKV